MKTPTALLPLLAALTLALAPLAARPHGNDSHASVRPAHGGQVRVTGEHALELVVARDATAGRDSPVAVYVSDHAGNKIATAGASGSVTLLAGATKATIALTPDGANGLRGSGRYAAAPTLKAVVTITLAGKPAEQARFTPLADAP